MSSGNHIDVEDVARAVLDAAFRIHTALGPGLLESAYEACLEHELAKRQFSVQKQVPMPVQFGSAYLPFFFLCVLVLICFLLFSGVQCRTCAMPLS